MSSKDQTTNVTQTLSTCFDLISPLSQEELIEEISDEARMWGYEGGAYGPNSEYSTIPIVYCPYLFRVRHAFRMAVLGVKESRDQYADIEKEMVMRKSFCKKPGSQRLYVVRNNYGDIWNLSTVANSRMIQFIDAKLLKGLPKPISDKPWERISVWALSYFNKDQKAPLSFGEEVMSTPVYGKNAILVDKISLCLFSCEVETLVKRNSLVTYYAEERDKTFFEMYKLQFCKQDCSSYSLKTLFRIRGCSKNSD